MIKLRWGVLSTAKIAREKVIPAIQASNYGVVTAIASANNEKATTIAQQNNIAAVYNSYEALLADPDIDAVYIPLPNHLHVPWSIKCLQAGKHVLCEKPIGLSVADAAELLQTSLQYPQLKIMEAFMYRFHPQWQKTKALIDDGSIGTLKTIQSCFSYFNDDPLNIRNKKELGGGGLMDIGCYSVSLSRFIFGTEPTRVFGHLAFDPVFQTDSLASGILDFETGNATFTCGTQLVPFQSAHIFGTEGSIEIKIPFTPAPLQEASIWLHTKNNSQQIDFTPTDQYTLQADQFALAILNNKPVPTPLYDAINNMKVLQTLFESNAAGAWKTII